MSIFSSFSFRFWGIVVLLFSNLMFLLFEGGKFAFMLFCIVTFLSLYISLGRWSGISNTKGIRTLPVIEQGGIIEAGMSVAVHVQVRIPGFWPVPYVTIRENLSRRGGEDYVMETILVPDWRRRAEVSYVTPPLQRGIYQFKDTDCATEDIFGLFRHRGRFQLPYTFKVYPQRINIREWKQLQQLFQGHPRTSLTTRFHRETTQLGGIRDYMNGDPLSRIHWPASARTGTWKSKEFEREAVPQIVLLLDRNMRVYQNQGQFELSVSIAASLLEYAISRNMAIGLLSAGEDTKFFEPKHGEWHKNAMMNHLIEMEPDGNHELLDILQKQIQVFAPGTLFVFITPQFGNELATSLSLLGQRRMKPCHMWVAVDIPATEQEQWMQYLRMADLPGYTITSLDKLPLVVGGNN